MMKNISKVNNPLEQRPYRFKNPSMEFYCPLCRTERAFAGKPGLSKNNVLQIAMLTLVTTLCAYPWAAWRGIFSVFFYWACFEVSLRVLFRKEIPCPHCGFDASWYKRDVKVARRLVMEFWENKNPTIKEEVVIDDELQKENN